VPAGELEFRRPVFVESGGRRLDVGALDRERDPAAERAVRQDLVVVHRELGLAAGQEAPTVQLVVDHGLARDRPRLPVGRGLDPADQAAHRFRTGSAGLRAAEASPVADLGEVRHRAVVVVQRPVKSLHP
jgi:hypothetical protein